MRSIVCLLLGAYILVLLARIFLSWLPTAPTGLLGLLNRLLFAVTEPLLAPIRSLIAPVRAGATALDLSPIIVFVAIILIAGVVC